MKLKAGALILLGAAGLFAVASYNDVDENAFAENKPNVIGNDGAGGGGNPDRKIPNVIADDDAGGGGGND